MSHLRIGMRSPQLLTNTDVPLEGTRIALMAANKLAIELAGEGVGILLREINTLGRSSIQRRPFTKRLPVRIEPSERNSMQPPSLMRISGSKVELDFTLADERAQIFRDAAAQSVDAAVGSYPGQATAGACVPPGRFETLSRQGAQRNAQLLARMAERGRFELPIRLPVCRISSAVHSTTLPPLRGAKA